MGILVALWFLVYGLVGVGVNIPASDMILAVLALIVGVVSVVSALK